MNEGGNAMTISERMQQILASSNSAAVYFGGLGSVYETDQKQIIQYRRLEREIRDARIREAGLFKAEGPLAQS
jgi:hypothetical protein